MSYMYYRVQFLQFISVKAQDPEITEVILPEIRQQGLSGSLRCVVINQMDNPVYWLRDRNNLHISTDNKIVVDDIHNEVCTSKIG